MLKKRPTIHNIARKARCSITVVSHALNDNPRINKKTRARIKKIARETGYHPNIFARALVTQRSELIGVVVPGILTSFYPEVIQGIKERLLNKRYGFLLAVSDDNQKEEERMIRFLSRRRIDGIIIAPCQNEGNRKFYPRIMKEIPLVFVDRFLDRLNINSVTTDNVQGGYLATRHLLELGHRRIGLLRAEFTCSTTRERMEGYEKALREYGVPADAELIKSATFHIGRDSYDLAPEVVGDYLKMKAPPTALFVMHDAMAVSVMSILINAGLEIPGDMSLIGYDDLPVVKHLPVPLTTISQAKAEMGRKAAEMLLELIKNNDRTGCHIKLKPELIIRRSCGKPSLNVHL